MNVLVDDLLVYFNNDTSSEISKIQTKDFVEEVVDVLNYQIKESKANLIFDNYPKSLTLDKKKVNRILQNLISNSIKFVKQDQQPKIQISIAEQDDKYVFAVADNGIGIEPQYQDRIFKPFIKLHSKDEYEGSGVGLSICSKLVNSVGGAIWVSSCVGEGTTVSFTASKS